MTARQQAVKDIKKELAENSKCFLAFHKELDLPLNNIVAEYLAAQRQLNTQHP